MDYFTWKASYTRNVKTAKAYKVWIDRFLEYTGKDPQEVTLEDVTWFRDSMKKKYAPANIQYGMSIIHDYLKFQMAHGLVFPIALFKVKRERANSHYVLREAEYQKMVTSLLPNSQRAVRDLVMMRVLWETGVRVGELTRMKMDDLVKQGCQIHNEKNTYRRNVYWSKETDELMRFYLSLRGRLQRKCRDVFVASEEGDDGISSRQVERIIKHIVGKNNLNKRICPHSFRHAFVHRQILRGISEPVVANMVGHASTNTIMTYSKLSSRELSAAWGMIPALSQIQVRGSVHRG